MLKKLKSNPKYGFVVVVLLGLAISMPNFAQYQVSALADQLRANLGLSQSNYSTIATAPLLAGILFAFLSGSLVDRFGVRVITVAVLVSGVGVILRIFANGFWSLYLCMIMMGCAATFVNANTPKIMSEWFPKERLTQFTGAVLAFSNVSMALGTGTAAQFSSIQAAFRFSAAVAAIIMVLFCTLIAEKKSGQERKDVGEAVPLKESLGAAIRCKKVWLCSCFTSGFIIAISSVCFFLPQALMSRGYTAEKAGWVSMAVTLGNMVSSFVSPAVIRKFGVTKKRITWMIVAFSVVAAALEAFAWKTSGVLLVVLLFMAGFAAVGFQAFFTTLPSSLRQIGHRYSGAATGLTLTIQLIFSVAIPSYVIAPIAGDNYNLMFLLVACIGLLPAILSRFAPVDDLLSGK